MSEYRRQDTLRVWSQTQDTVVIVRAVGQLDLGTAPTLKEHVRAAAKSLPTGVLVLDLRDVDFFGSVGLALLMETHLDTQRDDSGWELRLVADHRAVLRPLMLTGMHEVVVPYATVEHALAATTGERQI